MKARLLILLSLLCFNLIVLSCNRLRSKESSSTGIPAIGGTTKRLANIQSIPYFLQDDPHWGMETLGGSNERMAQAGCTISCVAMSLSALNHPINPLQLCQSMKEKNGFTESGLLIWNKISEVTNDSIQVDFPELSHEAIEAELQRKNPVIAKIMLDERIPHWVLIVGKEDHDYLIADPLNGEKTLLKLSERSKKIHAIRVLHKT